MWIFANDPDPLEHPQADSDSAAGSKSDVMSLGRYRSYGHFYERYWCKLFGVTQADMARFVAQIRVTDAAPTLTDLAQDIIRSRLRQGPQLQSGPAPADGQPAEGGRLRAMLTKVGRWDAANVWQPGDRVIVPVPFQARGRAHAPRLGEIVAIHPDRVVVHVDGSRAPQVLALGGSAISEGYAAAATELRALAEQIDEGSQVDYILWEYGRHVVSQLLRALEADGRFVELEGRWSLRDLTTRPTETELMRLAETMFREEAGPLTMTELMMRLPTADIRSFSRRLGLALALEDRPDLFRNVGTRTYPRWKLAGPPAVMLVANHAVYDPDTYAILCMPGETLSPPAAQRLWDVALLHDAIAPVTGAVEGLSGETEPAEDFSGVPRDRTSIGHPESRQADPKPAGPSFWPKWLRFSRQ